LFGGGDREEGETKEDDSDEKKIAKKYVLETKWYKRNHFQLAQGHSNLKADVASRLA
jgi:hypothetical protein